MVRTVVALALCLGMALAQERTTSFGQTVEADREDKRFTLAAPDAGHVRFEPAAGASGSVRYLDELGDDMQAAGVTVRLLGPSKLTAVLRPKGARGRFVFHPDDDALEPNDRREDAAPLAFGEWQLMALSTSADLDFVAVDVRERGHLYFDVAGAPDGLQPAARRVLDGGALDPVVVVGRQGLPVEPGVTTLRIVSRSNRSSFESFAARIRFVREFDDFAIIDGRVPRLEPGRVYAGAMMVPGETDGFCVNVSGRGRLHLSVVNRIGGVRSIGDALLYRGDTMPRTGLRLLSYLEAFTLTPGEHTFRFVNPKDRPIDPRRWEVQIDFVAEPDPDEPGNDTAAGATPLPLNKGREMRLGHLFDEDWFRIEVPGPGVLQIIAHDEGRGDEAPVKAVDLIAADGRTLVKTAVQLDRPQLAFQQVTPPDRTVRLKQGGTYFLRVRDKIGSGAWDAPFLIEANFAGAGSSPVASNGFTATVMGLALDPKADAEIGVVAASSGSAFTNATDRGSVETILQRVFEQARDAVDTSADEPAATNVAASEDEGGGLVVVVLVLLACVGAWLLVRSRR